MKLVRNIGIGIFLCWLMSACKKNELITYNINNALYFPYADSSKLDSAVFSFGYALPQTTDSIVLIPVKVMGSPAATDREYVLSVTDSSTARPGVDYDPLPNVLTIKAGKVLDTLQIKIHRTPLMRDTSLVLGLQLVANSYFADNYKRNKLRLFINDVVTKPKYWVDGYYGTFSRTKIYQMAAALEVGVIDIFNNSSIPQTAYWARAMQVYLNDMTAAGKPLLEADGSPMIMGPTVQ